MRPTLVQGGIKGLFPLIKANAPQAIRSLQRWEDVRGWRLAFDGTLLLAKLHFSSSNPHRHLMGLHHLLCSLRSAGVGGIFVFDNPVSTARLPQKAREHAKRREVRAKTIARAKTEHKRRARIDELRRCLRAWEALNANERSLAAKWLEKWQVREKQPRQRQETEEISPLHLPEEVEEEVLVPVWLDNELQHELQLLSGQVDVDSFLGDVPSSSSLHSSSSSLLTPRPRTLINPTQEDALVTSDLSHPSAPSLSPWDAILEDQTSPAYAVAHRIALLRSTYAAHEADVEAETTRQALLTTLEGEVYRALQSADSIVLGQLDVLDVLDMERESTQQDQPMEEQVELMLDKPDEPLDSAQAVPAAATTDLETPTFLPPTELLDSISLSNAHLAASYARHSDRLSSSIIRSAAELCTLHGIPVLWTGSGEPGKRPHEAEAVAARVVLDGYADAVVSEDSDTLLYDVPLIRGALGKEESFEIVDPKQVRKSFFPKLEGEQVLLSEEERELEEDAEKDFADQVAHVEMLAQPNDDDARAQEVVAAPASASPTTRKRLPIVTVPRDEESWRRMLELALLCGTDFNRTVPGIASRRALHYVRQHGRIRKILESEVIPLKPTKEATASFASSTSSSKRKRSSAPSATLDAASSLTSAVAAVAVPKLRTTPRFAPPDAMSWRAYSKELNAARAVFLNMPSLHREAARLKAWNVAFAASASSYAGRGGGAAGGAFDVDRVALAQFWRARVEQSEKEEKFGQHLHAGEEWELRRVMELAEAVALEDARTDKDESVGRGGAKGQTRDKMVNMATLGFGDNPFGDKPAAQEGFEESAVWRG